MHRGNMRFTVEQRLAQLERENVVLYDTTKLLHRMLKDQQELIREYITQALVNTERSGVKTEEIQAEKALYTFTCKQRFDRLEKTLEKLQRQTGLLTPAVNAI